MKDANDKLRAGKLPSTPFDEPPVREEPPHPAEEGSKKGEPMRPMPNPYRSVRDRIFEGVRRLSTGLPLLDAHLSEYRDKNDPDADRQHGFVVPSLVVLGAAPKTGKSTWAQLVVEHQIEMNRHVLMLDFENGPERWFRRLLCRQATRRLRTSGFDGYVSPETLRRVGPGIDRAFAKSTTDAIETTDRWINEAVESGRLRYLSDRNVELVREIDAHASLAQGPTLVVVDSLQRLPNPEGTTDRRAGVDFWLDALETATHRNKDLVVLLISELKRAPSGGAYELGESAFKESGRVEYAGALLMGLEPLATEKGQDDESRLSVLMDRDGRPGRVAKYASRFPFYGFDELKTTDTDETRNEKRAKDAKKRREKKKEEPKESKKAVPGKMVEVSDAATREMVEIIDAIPKPSNGKTTGTDETKKTGLKY